MWFGKQRKKYSCWRNVLRKNVVLLCLVMVGLMLRKSLVFIFEKWPLSWQNWCEGQCRFINKNNWTIFCVDWDMTNTLHMEEIGDLWLRWIWLRLMNLVVLVNFQYFFFFGNLKFVLQKRNSFNDAPTSPIEDGHASIRTFWTILLQWTSNHFKSIQIWMLTNMSRNEKGLKQLWLFTKKNTATFKSKPQSHRL